MPNLILYKGRYSVEKCRAWPGVRWVFGDNLIGVGKGGQAIIRDEPNALGVPTKRTPSMDRDAFFSDWDTQAWLAVIASLQHIERLLDNKLDVVIPLTADERISLGCGLANLPYYAPGMYHFLETWLKKMREDHGSEIQ